MKKIVFIFTFVFSLFLFNQLNVCAKVSSDEIFEIKVGEEKLPIYYTLAEVRSVFNSSSEEVGYLEEGVISFKDGKTYSIIDTKVYNELDEEIGKIENLNIVINDNTVYTLSEISVKERMQFNVFVKGKSESANSYKWEHKLCYKIIGNSEICEVDITGDDSSNKIQSNGEYSYYFYDGHMPYYSEDLQFEYVIFKNKFICLNCENDDEIILNDISFTGEEINYKYSYGIDVSYSTNEEKKYVFAYSSSTNNRVYVKALFQNNSGSNLKLEGAPTYKLINEICVNADNCVKEEIENVYNSNDSTNSNPLSITPYLGNLNFYYNGENLFWENENINYNTAHYKTTLVCLTNCDSRRVEPIIVLNDVDYYFDYTKPKVDDQKTIIDTYEVVEYIRYSPTKITVSDSESGIDDSRLKYYMVKPYSSSCLFGSETAYSFVNGEMFNLGENLNGGYCMYYVVYDKNGNYYKSDYYIYYFDNKGPEINFENNYDSSKYYNEVSVSVEISDTYSEVDTVYYLWSKVEIDERDYLLVKNNGKLYGQSINSGEISEDGAYYLYMLAYDSLNNYSLYDLGSYNIDRIGLNKDEIVIETSGFTDDYSNIAAIKVKVDEVSENEEFKCGFSTFDQIKEEQLNISCFNNQSITVPGGYEGNYNFFVEVKDRANNISIIKVLENLKIDTKGPNVNVDLLYDDNIYRIVNEITLTVSDLNGFDNTSLKYGWFSINQNVISSDLTESFINGEKFGYPSSYYGEYKLYVAAVDNLGNETFKAIDKIFKIDTDIIRISLIGEEKITILKGQEYEELGAKAYKGDVLTGGRVSEVNVEGNVDTSKAGTYYLTYSSGEGELKVTVTRTIVVKNDLGYLVIGVSIFVLSGIVICLRLFIRRKKA